MSGKRTGRRGEGLLREFIAQTLSTSTSGNRTIQGAPTRQGVGIRPGATAGVLEDEEQEMEAMPKSACVLITHDDGRILAVSRRDDPTAWGLPGGKVDANEDVVDAAARELKEETGLDVQDLHQVQAVVDSQGFMTVTFVGKISGEIDTDEEGLVRWVTPKMLVSDEHSPFAEYNRMLFKRLGIAF